VARYSIRIWYFDSANQNCNSLYWTFKNKKNERIRCTACIFSIFLKLANETPSWLRGDCKLVRKWSVIYKVFTPEKKCFLPFHFLSLIDWLIDFILILPEKKLHDCIDNLWFLVFYALKSRLFHMFWSLFIDQSQASLEWV